MGWERGAEKSRLAVKDWPPRVMFLEVDKGGP